MGRKLMGVFLLLVIGSAAILAVYHLWPHFKEHEQVATSDARKLQGKIVIALDNWIGYFPLRAPEIKAAMRRSGWQLVVEDDNADYRQRMARLKNGEIDMAVATVDSFLLNAKAVDFPGTIVAVIDESKGGDAIVARRDVVDTISRIKGKAGLRVAFTPDSPSHHLLKAAVDHFSVPELLPAAAPERIETNGSQEALKKLLAGKADLAVLWEPDVSRALAQPGVVKVLGTEDTERLIVDILVAGRKFAGKNPEAIGHLLRNYFEVLKQYRKDPNLLKAHIRRETGLGADAVDAMLRGVSWVNFNQNCETWFAVSAPGATAREGLVETIESTASILISAGDFRQSPVPGNDPYRIIDSTFLESLYTSGLGGFTTPGADGHGNTDTLAARFSPLSDSEWDGLKEVGNLKLDPIVFQSGSSALDLLAKAVLDRAVERLRHYPRFRVTVKGHTGTRGDPRENRTLSQDRAQAVAQYMAVTYNIDPHRLHALGFGGAQPLPREPGESKRAHEYRLPRVELVLVREEL